MLKQTILFINILKSSLSSIKCCNHSQVLSVLLLLLLLVVVVVAVVVVLCVNDVNLISGTLLRLPP